MKPPPQAPLSGHLARALERSREAFNARFARAKRMQRSLDPEAFAWVLAQRIAPIMDAVMDATMGGTQTDSAREDALAAGLFDAALDLCAARLLGPSPRHDLVDAVWAELLPALGPLLVQAPQLLAASLSNAAHALYREHGASNQVRPKQWLELMRDLAGLCASPGELLRAGQVAAWRAGMAHLREQAAPLCLALPRRVQRAALDLAQEGPALAGADLADPWALPLSGQDASGTRELRPAPPVGGFTGFGGPFAAPPEVAESQGRIVVFDSRWCWQLHADAYGATLKRLGRDLPEDFTDAAASRVLAADGTVELGGLEARFPDLARAASWAVAPAGADSQVLAVTLARSHKVFLLALQPTLQGLGQGIGHGPRRGA